MKTLILISIVSLALAGCASQSASGLALHKLDAVQGLASPAIIKESIAGAEVVMAKRGLWLVDSESSLAIMSLVFFRESNGVWPAADQIGKEENIIRIVKEADYLRLIFTNGSSSIKSAYLSKDGYMSIDPKYAKTMQDIEDAFTRPRKPGIPFIPYSLK